MHINMQKHSRIVTGGVGGLSRGAASRAQAQGRALQSERGGQCSWSSCQL